MRPALLFVVIALCLLPIASYSQIYKEVDEHGNVTYTDNARGADAEKIELPKTNTQPAVQFTPSASQDQEDETARHKITILSPADQATIPTGQRQVQVIASFSPALSEGQSLRLLLDGKAFGANSTTGEWLIDEIYRGEHTLRVVLQDAQGKTLSSSMPVTIFVQRHTILRGN